MSIAPPRPRPAPLNALRAFEAAARLGGFRVAAEELAVTPGAVAQQIRTLEDWAGGALFERKAQGVELSALGASVASSLTAAFDEIGAASARLRNRAAPNEIRIAALPSVAQLWLAPRLPVLRAAMPSLAASVTAIERPPNLLREAFDLALFFDAAPGAARLYRLADDEITPVASPARAAAIRSEDDLSGQSRIVDAAWAEDWASWSPRLASTNGPVHSLYALAVEEALSGGGVLMGHLPLIDRHLKSGALVAPFDRRVSLGRALTLSVAHAPEPGEAVAHVVDALIAAA